MADRRSRSAALCSWFFFYYYNLLFAAYGGEAVSDGIDQLAWFEPSETTQSVKQEPLLSAASCFFFVGKPSTTWIRFDAFDWIIYNFLFFMYVVFFSRFLPCFCGVGDGPARTRPLCPDPVLILSSKRQFSISACLFYGSVP